jgi:hypothetical protein
LVQATVGGVAAPLLGYAGNARTLLPWCTAAGGASSITLRSRWRTHGVATWPERDHFLVVPMICCTWFGLAFPYRAALRGPGSFGPARSLIVAALDLCSLLYCLHAAHGCGRCLRSPLPHLPRDWSSSSLSHLHRDWARPLPQLRPRLQAETKEKVKALALSAPTPNRPTITLLPRRHSTPRCWR